MAKSWQYPRSRRILMQAAMWLIFGGTIALAALVNRHETEARRVDLTDPQTFGNLELSLPRGWQTSAGEAEQPLRISEQRIDGQGDEGEPDRERIGEHVPGVREHREAARQDAADDLDHGEPDREREDDGEGAP